MRWTILFVLVFTGSLAAQQPQEKPAEKPSLAELARRSRERPGNAKVRTITNADLKTLRANVSTSTSPQVAAESTGAAAAQEAPAEDAEPAGELTEEELQQWRQALEEARQAVQSAVNEDMVLQLRMNNLRNAYLRQADGSTQQRIQAELQETLNQIQQSRQRQREARAALQSLQADAKAAGLTETQIEKLTGAVPDEPPNVLAPETGDSDN